MNKKISLTEGDLYRIIDSIRARPRTLEAIDVEIRINLRRLGRRLDKHYRSLSGHSFRRKSSFNRYTGSYSYKDLCR